MIINTIYRHAAANRLCRKIIIIMACSAIIHDHLAGVRRSNSVSCTRTIAVNLPPTNTWPRSVLFDTERACAVDHGREQNRRDNKRD